MMFYPILAISILGPCFSAPGLSLAVAVVVDGMGIAVDNQTQWAIIHSCVELSDDIR